MILKMIASLLPIVLVILSCGSSMPNKSRGGDLIPSFSLDKQVYGIAYAQYDWNRGLNRIHLNRLIRNMKKGNLNSIVIDMSGFTEGAEDTYIFSIQDSLEKEMKEFIRFLGQNHIRPVASFHVFHVGKTNSAINEQAFIRTLREGGDPENKADYTEKSDWVDPTYQPWHKNLKEIMLWLVDLGFKEIMYDYIRYPNWDLGFSYYCPISDEILYAGFQTRQSVAVHSKIITETVDELSNTIKLANSSITASAAVFPQGNVINGTFQNLNEWKSVDVLCPMLYSGTLYGIDLSLKERVKEMVRDYGSDRIRVWAKIFKDDRQIIDLSDEDFTQPEAFIRQINAIFEGGANGFYLWSGSLANAKAVEDLSFLSSILPYEPKPRPMADNQLRISLNELSLGKEDKPLSFSFLNPYPFSEVGTGGTCGYNAEEDVISCKFSHPEWQPSVGIYFRDVFNAQLTAYPLDLSVRRSKNQALRLKLMTDGHPDKLLIGLRDKEDAIENSFVSTYQTLESLSGKNEWLNVNVKLPDFPEEGSRFFNASYTHARAFDFKSVTHIIFVPQPGFDGKFIHFKDVEIASVEGI